MQFFQFEKRVIVFLRNKALKIILVHNLPLSFQNFMLVEL